ncbi:helix-turn-helix transcriptional regulator [Tritonibacter horizontis]|uniref:Virulence regulon transcriptional activator VirF n=1 Tax=Tritonibacter horizontis TaxID=1768241 RepID=A0A132BUT8_9RHOB|nr:helix-turn-helix transcriptional regulator [Tritonibacter horizontis]KUP91822.1 virulence regulon transcriptional activator VirF [Tritonibacter horizontis]
MTGSAFPTQTATDFKRKLDWFTPAERPKPQVFDGLVTAVQLQAGLGLHTLNATARQAFAVDGQRPPGAVLHCFLEGSTDARLDGKPMNLGRRNGEPVRLVLTAIDETQSFTRQSHENEYVRKVSIQMSHAWLDTYGFALPGTARAKGGQRMEWLASPEDVAALETLARFEGFTSPLVRLQAEATSLALLGRSFETLGTTPSLVPAGRALSDRECKQLRRIEDLARAFGALPSLRQLATEAGLSQSSLRRLVQSAYGRSPLEHVRHLRLHQIREDLERGHISIETAAELSGYSAASNFATAFRRTFGVTPSQVKRKTRSQIGDPR